ncbi:Fruit-body specific protein a [Mycena sanguinolenta]|uniref:Fruit-body specific protein a n=1 Tax=Mycena sanguinolenta TaxID=230812 RepID=A0A8H7DI39_9AGAR|nr:Fruit-body specific protein a [Mycena sanguinolenta]
MLKSGANAVQNGCIYALTTVELNMATISCPGAVVVPPPPTTTFAPGCAATSTPTPSAAACATVAFQNLNASIQGDDFLTFTLTETVEECLDFCACLPGGQCGFANPNFDNAKNTTMLTCAVYAGCHTAADATNTGGQSLPGGGVSTVTNSSGFCLKGCMPRC